jgi:hypothetical protein
MHQDDTASRDWYITPVTSPDVGEDASPHPGTPGIDRTNRRKK